jgi:outer membrane protein assembly factor BamB
MLAGCEALATGEAARVSLPFYESAWELVIRREGDEALVSFYCGGMSPRIEVKDRRVSFPGLVVALLQAGDQLVERLQQLNAQVLADPFIGETLGALERLRGLDEARPLPAPSLPDAVEISHVARSAGGLAFGYRLTATDGDLLAPTTPDRSDLYSLMTWGRLECVFHGRCILTVPGRVFFMLESLLLACRHLLGSLEESRDLELVLDGESLRIEAHHDADGESATLTLSPQARRGPGGDASTDPAVLGGLGALEIADAVLAAARDFRRQVLDVNPTQRSNLKFELFSSEISTLSTWRRDLTDSTILNTAGNSLRYEMPRPTLPRHPASEGRLRGARRLMYAKRWEAEAEGLRLDATFLCGDRLVVGSRNVLAALDRDGGQPLWRREGLGSRCLALVTGETGMLLAGPGGEVSLLDLDDGRTRWTTRVAAPRGKPAGVVAGGGRRPRWAVLTTGQSDVTAVDLYTGEARWRFRTRRGRPTGFARMGRLLAFTCRSTSVYCLDVDTGDLVWRLSERSRIDLPPASLGEMVAVWMSGPPRNPGRIVMLDALTGETLWAAPARGTPLTLPVRCGAHVVAAQRLPAAVRVQAWTCSDGEPCWEHELGGIEGPVSLLALDRAVLLHSAQGVVMCLDAASGRVTWSRELVDSPTVELPLSLEPVLRDGGLFVPLDTTYVLNPTDGSLLHRLDGDSPVPDLLRVDEQYSIYTAELSGHVSAYGVIGHLDVVRG